MLSALLGLLHLTAGSKSIPRFLMETSGGTGIMIGTHEQEAEAILRDAAYQREDVRRAVISTTPDKHDSVRGSVFKGLGPSSAGALGNLARLPVEIISSICLELDVHSALRLSHVNRRSREILSAIPAYRRLGDHALECIWGLCQTRLASHTGVTALYEAMTTERCTLCGSFGGFVFLPTVTRCCFDCIQKSEATQVISVNKLHDDPSDPAAHIDQAMPVLHAIPGSYSLLELNQTSPSLLVSRSHARGLIRTPTTDFDKWSCHLVLPFMASMTLTYVDPKTGQPDCGHSCRGCSTALTSYFSIDNYLRSERVYPRDAFLVHYRDCRDAQRLRQSVVQRDGDCCSEGEE